MVVTFPEILSLLFLEALWKTMKTSECLEDLTLAVNKSVAYIVR
jgi:hypothetical protein